MCELEKVCVRETGGCGMPYFCPNLQPSISICYSSLHRVLSRYLIVLDCVLATSFLATAAAVGDDSASETNTDTVTLSPIDCIIIIIITDNTTIVIIQQPLLTVYLHE